MIQLHQFMSWDQFPERRGLGALTCSTVSPVLMLGETQELEQ